MSAPANELHSKPPAQKRLLWRALAGVALIGVALLMVLPRPYRERTFLIDAGGCRLQTTVYEPATTASAGASTPDAMGSTSMGSTSIGSTSMGSTSMGADTAANAGDRGTVVLFHGLAANRKIMSYLAEGFALEGLRVFVPDLPGHGRTAGPFSAARAEECSENLLHELRSRGMAAPERTILAGHSMGGALAIRVGARVPVAGVLAISPAPMRMAHGASRDMLLFESAPPLPPNTEVVSGGLEPEQMTANARDLLEPERDVNSRYVVVPWATHAGLLWRPAMVRVGQEWVAKVLHLDGQNSGAETEASAANSSPRGYALPSRLPLAGCVLGLAGILLIAGPFLQEALGASSNTVSAEAAVRRAPWWRAALELLAVGLLVVVLLRYWMPLRWVRLFQGDYLAGFLLFTGLSLISMHWKSFMAAFEFRNSAALKAMFAAMVLFLIFSAWFELSLTEAWLDTAHWQRFPLLCVALLPCLAAEEILLGSPAQKGEPQSHGEDDAANSAKNAVKRVAVAMLYRSLLWLALVFGIVALHSGEILLLLLAPYFAVLSIPHRRGMDVVREVTGSAAAAALFGAILLAGFFLVIFPLL